AELDYLVTRVRLGAHAVAPFGIVARRDGHVVCGLAGRIEERTLPARLGYRTIVAPRVRLLHVVQGGIVGTDVIEALRPALSEVDAVVFPALPVGSDLAAAARELGG